MQSYFIYTYIIIGIYKYIPIPKSYVEQKMCDYILDGRGHSAVSISCCAGRREGKEGPAFFKYMVHRALTAICYMLETKSVLVASQESQDSANLHKFKSFLLVLLVSQSELCSFAGISLLFDQFSLISSLFCRLFTFNPVYIYYIYIYIFFSYFASKQCPLF